MQNLMKPHMPENCNLPRFMSEQDERIPPNISWGEAVKISSWYGREHELAELERWITVERCRLIAVVGMGGMGKTALVIKLVQGAQKQFDGIIWLSLHNAPPLEVLVMDGLRAFCRQQEYFAEGSEQNLALFMRHLSMARYLVILDNMETILQAGEEGRAGHYLAGYEDYGHFLRQVGEAPHHSCLIITSREKPTTLSLLEGKHALTRSFCLSGLEQSASEKLLQEQDLTGSEQDYAALSQHYAGNPLGLRLAAGVIHDIFAGNISAFLHKGERIFSDIRDLLDEQFERLSQPEKRLLYWLAIGRELVSLDDLVTDIAVTAPGDNILEVLDFLRRRRSWIERGEAGQTFTLQPVIMQYVTARLLEQIHEELQTNTFHLLSQHALVKAQSKDAIRTTQQRLLLKPLLDRLLIVGGRKQVEQVLFQALLTLQHAKLPLGDYAAGNLLNLLVSFTSDLRGRDFSHLTIRHAYLQEVDLREANFTGSAINSSVFIGTCGTVFSLAFSSDERRLAVGTTSGAIYVWDISTGQLLFSCEGHHAWVMTLSFNTDGTMLASGGGDHCVKLWDLQHGQHFKTLRKHTREVSCVLFSPDRKLLASASYDQHILLWDMQSLQPIRTLGHGSQVNTFAYSPDGKFLASGSADHSVYLWVVESGICLRIWRGHVHKIEAIVFSPDGYNVISVDTQTVRTWDIATDECLAVFDGRKGTQEAIAVHVTHVTTLIASGETYAIELYDPVTRTRLKMLDDEHSSLVSRMVFSSHGTFLASVDNDQRLKIWEVQSGRCLKTLQGYTNPLWSLAFHPDGILLASGGDDHLVRIWNASDGCCLKTLQGHTNTVTSLAFSADGHFLASGSGDESVRIWEVQSGRCLKTLQGHGSAIWSLAFCPDGSRLLCGCRDQSAKVWEMHTGQCLHSLSGQTEWADALAVTCTPRGTLLAASSKNIVTIWDVYTGERLSTLAGHRSPIWSLTFSADGSLLATGSSDQSIKLWDMVSGTCLHTLQGHEGWISTLAFRLDGNMLASGSSDRRVNLWSVRTGELVTTQYAHTNRVTAVTLSPAGNMVISSDFAEHIIQWNGQAKFPIRRLHIDRPYERMNITDITGVTEAQKSSFKALGAVEDVQGKEAGSLTQNMAESIALTRRERDILRLVRDNYTNNEIAQTLYISKATVKTHINHLFTKLGVQDRVQAVVVAQQFNFLP